MTDHSPDHAERATQRTLTMASEAELLLRQYLDARRRRKAWTLVSRGLALHPPIAQDIVKMVARAATMGGSDD